MTVSSRSSRQSFLGENSEHTIDCAKVAIVGLGGGGSHVAQQLAHLGVGNFVLIDSDQIEESNLNRLVGGGMDHVKRGARKTEIAKQVILAVNPKANVISKASNWEESHEALRDCSVVFGCVDSFLARDQLERYCRRFMLPYIDIGMDVKKVPAGYSISGQVILSIPGLPCMRCMGFLSDALINAEVQRYGAAGARPQVIWVNGVLASTAVGLFIQMITPWREQVLDLYVEYDGNKPYLQRSKLLDLIKNKACLHFSKLEDIGDINH